MSTRPTPSTHTLRREAVGKHTGISTFPVRRLEWTRLPPVQDERGIWRFHPAELEGIERRRTGQRGIETASTARAAAQGASIAARAFAMFARRKTLPEIVLSTKQPPEIVRALYHEWTTSLDEGEWEARDRADCQ
jgi:hypothetical protein